MSLSNEQKNKIKEKFEKTFEECNGGFLINSWATRDNFLDFFLSQFDSLQAEAKEEYKSCGKERSPLWDTFVDIIDEQFPKGQCKERGKALVMLAYIDMAVSSLIKKAREELRKEIEKMYKSTSQIYRR